MATYDSFEQQYYEDAAFWDGSALAETSGERYARTAWLVPLGARSLLDAGCGNGLFLRYLARHRPRLQLHGLDRSLSALRYVECAKHQGSLDAIPFPDQAFDAVTCLEVVEHLPHGIYEQALAELARVSSRWIVISVPYRENLDHNATRCPECQTVFNADLHLRTYDETTMQTLFSAHGLRCARVETMGHVERYVGHHHYARLFYRERSYAWRISICPLCGYRGTERPTRECPEVEVPKQSAAQRILARAKRIPKAIWPKESRPYWIIAVYER